MTASTQPVKLALFLDSWMQPRWVHAMLSDVIASGLAVINAVALNSEQPREAINEARWKRLARNWRAVPYGVFQRLDRVRSMAIPDPFEIVDVRPLCTGSDVREVVPRRTKFSDYFPDDAIAWLRTAAPDVVLRLGFRILRGEALSIAPGGVWSFHHGDNRQYRGGPAAYWEVVEAAPFTGAILQVLSEDLDAGRVLYRTCVPTHPVSPATNRAQLYWAAARGLSAALKRYRANAFEERCEDHVIPYSSRMYVAPGPGESLGALATLNWRRVRQRLHSRAAQWNVGFRFDKQRASSDAPDLSPHRLTLLASPRGALWADPFVIAEGDRQWILFEEVPLGAVNGRISAIEIDSKGKPGPMQVALERPHHLSYPCVFHWNGEWYMVPESFDAGVVEVFRARTLPTHWERVHTMLEGAPIVDPTIFEHGGRWWMFGSRPTPETRIGEELFAWHAETPMGPWTEHVQNPIRAGVDGSRPAGLPFISGGKLIRPGQIGAPRYGAGVRFFEIEMLTPTRYLERDIGSIVPNWNDDVIGYHTVNAFGKLTVGDVLSRRAAVSR